MIMRGIRLPYLNLSFKLKELKDNIIEKYLNNLLLEPSQNNLDSPLKNKLPPSTSKEFIEWFVGFTDAEGCFSIRTQNGNISLIFTIELHKDDVEVLHKIADALGIGRVLINKNKDSALFFFISKFEDINSVIIPLFKNFPLQTSKYLDFLNFADSASIIWNSKSLKNKQLSSLEVEKLINLKQSTNTKRLILNEEENRLLIEKVSISKWWLLGFIEGEGTFGYKHLVPYFQIAQNKKNLFVLKAIEAYLLKEFSLINSKNKELEFKYNLNKLTGVYSMTLEKIDENFFHVVPFFESLTFLSRKYVDYQWWVISVFIHKLGYFYLPEGKQIALQISSSTNKYRYTTKEDSNKIGLPGIESILNLFKQTPPFDIYSNRSHFELVRGLTIAKGGSKGFTVHIYECNSISDFKEVKGSPFSTYGDGHEVLGLKRGSRVIGRYIDTGKLYKDKYRFSSISLK